MISKLGHFLITILSIYNFLLIIRVIISWVNLPYSKFTYWLGKFTDPVIDYFRKNFPIRLGMLDFSILVPFFIITILIRFIQFFMVAGNPFTILYIILLLLSILDGFFRSIMTLLVILAIIYIVMKFNSSLQYNPFFDVLNRIFSPLYKFTTKAVNRIYKISPDYNEKVCLILMVVFLMAAGFIGHKIFIVLQNLVYYTTSNNHALKILPTSSE